jgi:exonuclease III
MLLYSFILFSLFIFSNCDSECPNIITPSQDRRINKNNLRLVQYNVEWLFIDHYNSSDCPGDGCTWKNVSMANTHMNYVSKVVSELEPDILNLCEVEGCDELNILISQINNNKYIPYLKKGTDTSTGQNVGMISQIDPIINLYRTENRYDYPIKDSKCNYTGTGGNTGVSKHYITEFFINNINIAFIGAHLLAIPTDPLRCAEREAQAMILQKIIANYYNLGYEIIMLGDFNDYDGEVLDLNNHIPISYVLDILKGKYGDKKDVYHLYSVAENINQSLRFSDWYDAHDNCKTVKDDFSMIDHILVTEHLKNKIKNVFIYHGYEEYCGKYNSDHYPVIVDFIF